MSTEMQKPSKSFEIHTRVQPFNPTNFNVNDELHHLEAKFTGQLTSTRDITPAKQGVRLIEKKFMEDVEKRIDFKPLVRIGASRMIAQRSINLDADAFVTVFTGKGRPTEEDVTGYERVNMSRTEQTEGLRFQWVKVEIAHDVTRSAVPYKLLQKLADSLDSTHYVYFHVKVELTSTPVHLRDILWHTGDAANPDRRNFNLVALNALVAKGEDCIPTSITGDVLALHGHKSYRLVPEHTTTIRGLNFITGTARKLWFNGYSNDSFVLSQSDCAKFFFPTVSVAELLADYLATTKTLYDVKDALVGVKVRIRTQHSLEEKHVLKLGELPATVSEDLKHPAWVAKGKEPLHYPDLPCVDIGSASRPELIPAEMCKILPMQSAGKGVPVAAQITANHKRFKDLRLHDSSAGGLPIPDEVISSTHPKVTVEEGKRRFSAAFDKPTKILFVEVGTGEKAPDGWKDLCKRVVSNAHTSHRGDIAMPDAAAIKDTTLSLTYKPGTDLKSVWEKQLRYFTTKHCSSDREEHTTLLVVAIMTSGHEKAIYEALKTICDTSTIGKQTFFVNMGTLAGKQRESPTEGAKRAANEISQRMRIRNPPSASKGAADISIGMHVTRFVAQTAVIQDDGSLKQQQQEQRFLVTIVSRELEKPQGYKTTRELVTEAKIKNFDPMAFVQAHFQDTTPDHVILFRSGYVPENSPPGTVKGRGILQHDQPGLESVDFKLGDTKRDKDLFISTITSPKRDPGYSLAASANAELLKLQAGLPDKEISYILVDESDAFEITAEAKATISQKAEESVKDAKSTNSVNDERGIELSTSTSFFIKDERSVSDGRSHTIKTHRKMSPKSGGKTVSLTLLGASLTVQQQKGEPSSRDASVADESDPESSPTRDLSDPGEDEETPKAKTPTPQPTDSPTRQRGAWLMHTDGRVDTLKPAFNPPVALKTAEKPTDPNQYHAPTAERAANKPHLHAWPPHLSASNKNYGNNGQDPQAAEPVEAAFSADPLANGSTVGSALTNSTKPSTAPSKGKDFKKDRHESPDGGEAADSTNEKMITSAELEVLADFFYDTQLELYDTKLPIPTYLAQAAAKRAKLHLKHSRKDDTEEVKLPAVADEVAKSLYYL